MIGNLEKEKKAGLSVHQSSLVLQQGTTFSELVKQNVSGEMKWSTEQN